MAFREVPVFEVREVLRLWLDGRGYRAIAGLVRPDRKTVTRMIETAVGLGLDRDGGVGQLDDVFVGSVMAAIRQVRPDRHGESWALLERPSTTRSRGGSSERCPGAARSVELLARSGVVVPERTVNRYVGR